jgi:hypothetical protein
MRKVAVFGNAGGGKSTLARRLAEVTGLPLYPLDRIQFRAGGGKVPYEEHRSASFDALQVGHEAPRPGPFVSPEGWPENSPMWSSTLDSYRVIWRCHRGLTPRHRQLVADAAASKRVHHSKSPAAMRAFLQAVQHERQSV